MGGEQAVHVGTVGEEARLHRGDETERAPAALVGREPLGEPVRGQATRKAGCALGNEGAEVEADIRRRARADTARVGGAPLGRSSPTRSAEVWKSYFVHLLRVAQRAHAVKVEGTCTKVVLARDGTNPYLWRAIPIDKGTPG